MTSYTAIVLAFALAAPVRDLGEPKVKANIVKAELILPRFAIGKVRFVDHPGLDEAMKSVPSLKAKDLLFSFSGSFLTRVTFDPAKADIGDIARVVAAVPVADEKKQKPAAILLVFTAVPREGARAFTEEQSVRAWRALESVAGIDVAASRKRTGAGRVFFIVLDDKGGARLAPILAAIESAGIEFQPR